MRASKWKKLINDKKKKNTLQRTANEIRKKKKKGWSNF